MADKIKIVCGNCGGENVKRDAWAVWSEPDQDWELGTVFDQGYCDDCEGEAQLEEVQLETGEGSPPAPATTPPPWTPFERAQYPLLDPSKIAANHGVDYDDVVKMCREIMRAEVWKNSRAAAMTYMTNLARFGQLQVHADDEREPKLEKFINEA